MATVAFVHAHPDDEAIFTGGTMAALATHGHRVVLVVATGGELGESHHAHAGAAELAAERLAAHRRVETDAAAALLGVDALHFLGHRDSGMAGDPANRAPGSFWSVPVVAAAEGLAEVLVSEAVDVVIVYDDHGIYGHPDHVQAHRVGLAAAERAGVACRYEVTVDREHLHFVETHLVEEAVLAGDLGVARSSIGRPSVEIDLALDVRGHLEAKRRAMAAHASQIPEHAPVLALGPAAFAEVYGWEWFVRLGPPGALDDLAAPAPTADLMSASRGRHRGANR